MKVLIVGGNSNLGVALKPVLISKGIEVITSGRSGENCDIRIDMSKSKIALPMDLDAVVYTPFRFANDSSNQILDVERDNVEWVSHLCNAVRDYRAKHLIFVSSIFATLTMSSPYFTWYAMAKKHCEEICTYFCQLNEIPLTIIRPSQIYGDTDAFAKHQPFFYDIINKAQRGEDVVIYGKNNPRRNYIHIDDITRVISEIVSKKVYGTYNYTHPYNVSYFQIANHAFLAFKKEGIVRFDTTKGNVEDNIFPNDFKLYEKIGFYPQISIEEGIKRIAKNRI